MSDQKDRTTITRVGPMFAGLAKMAKRREEQLKAGSILYPSAEERWQIENERDKLAAAAAPASATRRGPGRSPKSKPIDLTVDKPPTKLETKRKVTLAAVTAALEALEKNNQQKTWTDDDPKDHPFLKSHYFNYVMENDKEEALKVLELTKGNKANAIR